YLGVITLVGVLLLPGRGEFYQKLYVSGTEQEAVVSESGDSVLALTYEPDTARQAGLFWIGGEINSFFPAKGLYEGRALACAGAVQPKRILIIGFGGGFSALFYKSIPDVEEIVIVELLGEIGPFLQDNLESAHVTLRDPRLTYVVDDGRRYLNAFPDEKFDLISIDPLRDHTAGHNNLYSIEAMEIYRSHLTSGGVLCVWMDEHHIIPNTVAQAFPYVDQYVEEFMVASNDSIVYNTAYMDRAVHNYASLTEELYGPQGRVVLGTQFSLSRFVRDQSQIRREEGHKQTLRDMQPLLEYYLFQRPVKEEFRIDDAVIGNFQKRIE
ncbi:MAG: hypothetical protein M3Y68_14890, partial [Chloroflexota bacterium]|nr:hypothetical protein [Chloroflexota bacterium]